MNCLCPVPLPAALRQVSKPGDNCGRYFFTCPNGNCKLFSWAHNNSVSVPPPRYPSNSSKSSSGQYASTCSAVGRSGGKVVLGIGEIEPLPPQRIWFSVMAAADAALLNYYSTLPLHLRKQCPKTRVWHFDFSLYESFVRELKSGTPFSHLEIVELPRFLSQGLPLYQKYLPTSFPEPNILPGFRETLLPFQLDGLKYVISHGGRALIADEMGCGKTLSAIAIIMHYRDELPALVMLPASLARQWKSELLKHASEIFSSQDICLITKSSEVARGKIALVPYSLIDKMADSGHIRPDQFGIVIADEVHNLKNPDAKRTEICLPYLKHAKVAIGLSGTPILNRPKEIFTTLSALLPRIFNNYNDFIIRYCNAKKVPYGKGIDDSGASNTAELYTVLGGIVMVRRLKDDVVTSLPPKRREIKHISPDPKYVHQLKTIKSEMESLKKQLDASAGFDDGISMKLRSQEQQQLNFYKQVTGLSKVHGVCNIIRDLVKRLKSQSQSSFNLTQTVSRDVIESKETNVCIPIVADLTCDDTNFGVLEDDILMNPPVAEKIFESFPDPALEPSYVPSTSNMFIADENDIAICDSDAEEDSTVHKRLRNFNRLKHTSTRAISTALQSALSERSIDVGRKSNRILRSARKKVLVPITESDGRQSDSDGDDLFFLESTNIKIDTASDSDDQLEDHNSLQASSSDEDIMFGGKYYHDSEDKRGKNDFHKTSSETWKKILGGSIGKDINEKGSRKRKAEGKEGQSYRKKLNLPENYPVLTRKNRLSEKFIIFAHHREVMDQLEDCLRELEVDYVRLDGSSSNSTRNATVTDFQERDVADIALLALKACGTGLNLTAASTAIFAELDWSPATMFQAEDRIHRIGQKAAVVKIIYTIAEETADLIIWDLLQKKHGIVDATVGASDKGNRIAVALHNREAITGQTTLNFGSVGASSQSNHSQSFDTDTGTENLDKKTLLAYKGIDESPIQIKSIIRKEAKSIGTITQYMSATQPASEVYGRSCKSGLEMAPKSVASVISLIDEKFNEIPSDLIEQQFQLADKLAFKRKEETGTSDIAKTILSSPKKVPLLQSIHVENSQFDYPASQPSQYSGGKVKKNETSCNSLLQFTLESRVSLSIPVAEKVMCEKPKLGWNLAATALISSEETISSAPFNGQLTSPSGLNNKINLQMNPPISIANAAPSSIGYPKIIDEATRSRIEENKRKAQLLLQQRKLFLANSSGNQPVQMPTDRAVAKVSPSDDEAKVAKDVVRATSNSYTFATGKGRSFDITEDAIKSASSSEIFTSSSIGNNDSSKCNLAKNRETFIAISQSNMPYHQCLKTTSAPLRLDSIPCMDTFDTRHSVVDLYKEGVHVVGETNSNKSKVQRSID